MAGTKPFLLSPAAKDYLWGGNRLNDDFSKGIDLSPLAETWECSTHPDGVSTVASGFFRGKLLTEVLSEHPEFLGTHPQAQLGRTPKKKIDAGTANAGTANGGTPNVGTPTEKASAADPELPILIKFIDAKKDLSVQVHPSDAYAAEHENGQLGKTEMWYVMDAAKGASLVYGFRNKVSRETVKRSIENGNIGNYLQKVRVKKDDVFFIEAGTVHAIGAGALIAEIQENSNLTYRLYDYDRVDKNGNKRPLHIEKALDVADLSGSPEPRQPMRVLKFKNGYATELLCRCAYFQVERMLLNTETCRNMASFCTDGTSFQVLLCVDGCGSLYWEDDMLNFYKGDCIFIPADSVTFRLHGKAQFLKVNC